MKKLKIRLSSSKLDLGFESQLRMEKLLAPNNVRPKIVL